MNREKITILLNEISSMCINSKSPKMDNSHQIDVRRLQKIAIEINNLLNEGNHE